MFLNMDGGSYLFGSTGCSRNCAGSAGNGLTGIAGSWEMGWDGERQGGYLCFYLGPYNGVGQMETVSGVVVYVSYKRDPEGSSLQKRNLALTIHTYHLLRFVGRIQLLATPCSPPTESNLRMLQPKDI